MNRTTDIYGEEGQPFCACPHAQQGEISCVSAWCAGDRRTTVSACSAPPISSNLPGFCTYHELFERLGGPFENVVPAEDEKKSYRQAMLKIDGSPAHEFRQLRDDLDLTAQVREVRRYADGKTFVRFEFKRLTSPGEWGLPLQLMVLFGRNQRFLAYTVLQDRGILTDGAHFALTRKRYKWDSYRETDDAAEALRFLKRCKAGEIAVMDKATDDAILYVYAGMPPHGTGYDLEWYLGCAPWLLTVRGVDYGSVESTITSFINDGVTVLEDSANWQQFDFRNCYCNHGVTFDIDLELNRYLLRAIRDGDKMVEETIRAVGVDGGIITNPLKETVSYGSSEMMLAQLANSAVDENVPDDRDAKIECYLALRGRRDNIHNLGWRFHFGKGVPTDYEKAIFWQEKSAVMGDAYSMQNLGVIYSESGSPVHNCQKARAWFEKAIARGETLAMEGLAHCLLCGQNGRDDARALELARRAAEANPDIASIQETYTQARQAVA